MSPAPLGPGGTTGAAWKGPGRAVAAAALALLGCRRGTPARAVRTTDASAWRCPAPGPREPAPDPGVLVVVHSFAGHGALVGCELAEMFGGRFLRFGDAPADELPTTGPTEAQSTADLHLAGVRRIFLGFPIWGASEPSEPIRRAVARLDLRGIEVVPFFTHIHYADPAAMDGLRALVRARGGTWLPPIALRTPFWMSPPTLRRQLHRAVFARPDVLGGRAETAVRCGPAPGRRGGEVCRVPAGAVWLGDDGSAQSPDGYDPPRRTRTGAFEIDRAEATVEQYARCAAAGACRAGPYENSQCQRLVAGNATLPAPCMSFHDAQAFCAWAGMRLPTEAEWVRAGRGDAMDPYPWGQAFPVQGDPLRGNFGERPSTGMPGYTLVPPDADLPVDGAPGLSPGCRYPAGNSPFGVCDLAGNLYEWVARRDAPPPAATVAALKGGAWLEPDPAAFRLGARAGLSVERTDLAFGMYLTGFRCARPVDAP